MGKTSLVKVCNSNLFSLLVTKYQDRKKVTAIDPLRSFFTLCQLKKVFNLLSKLQFTSFYVNAFSYTIQKCHLVNYLFNKSD